MNLLPGTTLNPVRSLPDETAYTEDEMSLRLQLYRNGVKQRYQASLSKFYHYNSSASGGTITLQFAATTDDEFEIVWL